MSDQFYDKVSLLLPMFGSNNGTVFTDYSPVAKTISLFGNTVTVTAQSKYYGSSGYFDGSGDYLTVPDSAAFDFSVSPVFTVEMWVRLSANITNYAGIVGQDNSTASQSAFLLFFNVSNQILLQTRDTANTRYYAVATEAEMTLNTWHHLSISVDLTSGFVWTGFNGVVTQRTALSTSINNSALPIEIGRFTTYHYFKGYLQDLRITKGIARYTSNFTPPERLIGQISGIVTNDVDEPVARRIFAVPRLAPVRTFGPVDSAADGTYTLSNLPCTEHSVVCLDDTAGTVYNDLVHRVVPA